MRFNICILVFVVVTACSKDNNSDESRKFSVMDLPQTWELSYLNAGLSGELINAEEIPVLEIYVFKENGTFSKEFQDDFTEGNINGTYDLVINEDREYLILAYDVDMDSLSYCSKNNIENILISDNGSTLSNGSCLAFDGPGMYYQRIK